MDNLLIQLSQEDIQLIPLLIGTIQIIKQSDYMFNLLKEWLTLIGLGLGIVFVYIAHGGVLNYETVFTGVTVGILSGGSYDVIKNLTPKLANKAAPVVECAAPVIESAAPEEVVVSSSKSKK
jgi:hypothetical protein